MPIELLLLASVAVAVACYGIIRASAIAGELRATITPVPAGVPGRELVDISSLPTHVEPTGQPMSQAEAAEIASTLSKATSRLIESLEHVPHAAMRLGNLLFVKVTDGTGPKILVESISPALMQRLDEEPQLLSNPHEMLRLLKEHGAPGGPAGSQEQLPGNVLDARSSGEQAGTADPVVLLHFDSLGFRRN